MGGRGVRLCQFHWNEGEKMGKVWKELEGSGFLVQGLNGSRSLGGLIKFIWVR